MIRWDVLMTDAGCHRFRGFLRELVPFLFALPQTISVILILMLITGVIDSN